MSPNPASRLISQERIERGRWIYSAWKHLRGYSVEASASFEATALAGKCCDLLGRMRRLEPYASDAVLALARDSRLSRIEFIKTVIPLLEQLGIFGVDRQGDAPSTVQARVLSEDDVMDQVARIWDALNPEPVERGALVLLEATAALPLTEEEAAAELVGAGLKEPEAARSIELGLSLELVRTTHIADFDTDFLYNDFLWGENIAHVSTALAALTAEIRASLRSLIDELHQHEGRPIQEIESAAPDLVELAASRGLIDATEIKTADGRRAIFHFTPRFRGFGVSRDDMPDALDQVKLVIASFAFSTRFATYKLRDPEYFLDRLIHRGYAGNASPIGTDYGAMEMQKIVDVEQVVPGSTRYRFRALKRDTLVEAHETMQSGALLVPNPRGRTDMTALREPRAFIDPVATRQQLAKRVGDRPLHDEALLAAVRQAAQRDRFR